MKYSVAIVFLSALFIVMGALCAVWACVSVTRGEYLTVMVVSGLAIFAFGMVAMMAIVASEGVRPRVEYNDTGTTFRPDRKVNGLLSVSTLGAYMAMAMYAIFAPLGMLDIPLPPGNRQYFVFAAIAGVLLGLPSLRQIVFRGGLSHLQLTAAYIELGTATSTSDHSWDDVSSVADRQPRARRPINMGTTYITTTDGRTRILASDWYSPGGHSMRKLVRFYWMYPEHRDELTDGRAVERLAAGL